jgi:hypothetical protein
MHFEPIEQKKKKNKIKSSISPQIRQQQPLESLISSRSHISPQPPNLNIDSSHLPAPIALINTKKKHKRFIFLSYLSLTQKHNGINKRTQFSVLFISETQAEIYIMFLPKTQSPPPPSSCHI